MSKDIKYTATQIQSVLSLLNQISVKGIENCKRICLIEQILQDPEEGEEKENGNSSEEEQAVSG